MDSCKGSRYWLSTCLDCCDLHLATSTCTIALVTIMVLVTMSGRSGRVSSFLLVRRIGCAGSHQPNPVGVWFARRMPNKMRKIHMRHRRQDRLRGVTPPSHGGNQKADLNHLGIHTTTARGACCREAVIGGVRLVDFQASPKSISHQPKHNSRVTRLNAHVGNPAFRLPIGEVLADVFLDDALPLQVFLG